MKINKLFFVWNSEKEEKWLNEMSLKGWKLISAKLFRYDFIEEAYDGYIYRVEILRKSPKHRESYEYIQFVEETGVECIGCNGLKVYFRKKAEDGEFDLFSDINSRIKYLKRIIIPIGVISLICVAVGLVNIIVFSQIFSSDPRYLNFIVGIMDVSVVLLIQKGLFALILKKRDLEKERILHE